MKRLCLSVLLLCTILSTACSKLKEDELVIYKGIQSRYDQATQSVAYNDEVQIIGLISKYKGDPFLDIVMDTAEKKLTEAGYHVIRKSPCSYTNSISEQQEILNEFVVSKVDGIIIIPNDNDELNEQIANAMNNSIPVVVVDTPIDTIALEQKVENTKYISFVQINNYQASYESANSFFESSDKVLKLLLIVGDLNNPNAVSRRNGVLQAVEENDNVDLVMIKSGMWQEHMAYNIVYEELSNKQDINLIMSSNDRMALGASIALDELGLHDDVIITGFDGTKDAVEAINNGKLAFTVKQEPTSFGDKSVDILMEMLSYQDVDKYNYIDTVLLTEGN